MRVICSDWYELLRSNEKVYTFMTKAQQKIEYRWDDFLAEKQAGKISEEEPYDPVVNFDQRFHYYDKYVDIVALLPETSTREEEEAKSSIWELEGLELELFMAMDPESLAAKAMNPKKRKPDPETDGEGISRHPTAQQVHQHPRNHQPWNWKLQVSRILDRHQDSLKLLMHDQHTLQSQLEKGLMLNVKKRYW